MHGLLIRDRKELSEQEKAEEQAAASAASGLLREVILLKKSRMCTSESFTKCMDLLKLNPELSLAWNFRREIIQSKQSLVERIEAIRNEIGVLNSVMVDLQMTKSYCLWNHRRWLLLQLRASDELSESVLKGEIELVKTILKLDGRNFHSWSYRQWLRQNFDIKLDDDIEYSKKLIEKDFSNYSAWFLRSWAAEKTGAPIEPEAELELVWNALFTEPNDQSCWQYHDWLLRRFPQLRDQDADYMVELEAIVDDQDSKYLFLSKVYSDTLGLEEKQEIVSKLVNIDPMRKGFYLEL